MMVQCKCGWIGLQSCLADSKLCPRCCEEFKPQPVETIAPGTNVPQLTAIMPGSVVDHRRAEVAFVAEQEPMAIYRFDDGTVVKAKAILMHVERIEGAYNADGSPVYNMTWNQVLTVIPSDAMKKKP